MSFELGEVSSRNLAGTPRRVSRGWLSDVMLIEHTQLCQA
jgi:hypothetical protein